MRSFENSVFYLELLDETSASEDIWLHAGENSLRGIFLKKLLEIKASTNDSEKLKAVDAAAEWGLAALDNMEEVSMHDY